jgi:phytoene dehydrogenase-like protein
MTQTADIVVAGAGHNSLVAAAYLAKAGFECLVLDARPIPGGGAASEELLLPGYHIDSCSTGHTLIRVNPLLANDELGLHADLGLRYIEPDPVAHVAFPDGEHLTMWLDLERTCEEIAHFSKADAAAYRRLIADYHDVRIPMGAGRFAPAGYGPSLEERLRDHPQGNRWRRISVLSAWDVIGREFESRHVQAFLLWMAFQTAQPVDTPGSGPLAYSLVYGRQGKSWSIPEGGSGALTEALTRYIEARGGTILCDRRVTGLVLEGDRCTGVETADGERYMARRAVLSTIHVKDLVQMAPAEKWGDDFLYGVDTFHPGLSAFAVHLATTAPVEFATRDGGTQTAVSSGLAFWPEDIVRFGRDMRDGRFVEEPGWLLVATPTLADPSRAPAGHHTVKLLTMQAYDLPEREGDWEQAKARHAERLLTRLRRHAPGFTDDVVIASGVKSPVDIEEANPHMIRGTFHGGDRSLAFSAAQRPAPGWAQHRMPISGLYQTGGTTHPGGSITGAPGRNAAIVMLEDLGTSLDAVLAGEQIATGAGHG